MFASQLIDYLDSVIENAAARAGVVYVDTRHALDGHKLCEEGSKAVNGLTAGDDKLFLGNESYHPNAYGHQLLADAIASETHNLSAAMPLADSGIALPKPSDTLPILQAPKTNRIINEVLNAAQDIMSVQAGGSFNFVSNKFKDILPSNSLFTAVLHSTPVNLGTYHTTPTGQLNATLGIPASTEPGFHTVHFYGNDIAGNPIDIQQTIYVEASASDFDGDGITNVKDSCEYLPNSNVDIDKDGIDDTCDSTIGPAATNEPQQANDQNPDLELTGERKQNLSGITPHLQRTDGFSPTISSALLLTTKSSPENSVLGSYASIITAGHTSSKSSTSTGSVKTNNHKKLYLAGLLVGLFTVPIFGFQLFQRKYS